MKQNGTESFAHNYMVLQISYSVCNKMLWADTLRGTQGKSLVIILERHGNLKYRYGKRSF